MKSILFFDDFLIHRQDSIKRSFHTPKWLDEFSYSDPKSPYGMGYASVLPAPDGGYYLFYTVLLRKDNIAMESPVGVCMARSDDGLTWEPVDTGKSLVPGYNNVILAGNPAPGGSCVYYDADDPDPNRRYKVTISPVGRIETGIAIIPSIVQCSPDGIEWSPCGEGEFLPYHSDTYNSLLRNPVTGRYQITLRRRWGERRVCLVESENFSEWTKPRAILHPTSIDPVSTHFYGMPQFYIRDSGIFVGFLWNQHMPYNDVMGGPVQTEYAYSYDGLMWNRSHELSIGLRERGEFGGGSMYASALIEREEDILVYSVARLEEHGRIKEIMDERGASGVLLPGTLRKDGFVSLSSKYGMGEITTECLQLNDGAVSLNVAAPLGGVRVQVCDHRYSPLPGYTYEDSVEIRGDHLSIEPQWKDRIDLSEFQKDGRWIRLQIQMEQSELYSIRGDFSATVNDLAPVIQNL
ncbi:MAG: hypothetical protein HN368_22700, partial [Spirochaetales bacterium]|nr:hypothetical protein [Spirochaetales bacterium]